MHTSLKLNSALEFSRYPARDVASSGCWRVFRLPLVAIMILGAIMAGSPFATRADEVHSTTRSQSCVMDFSKDMKPIGFVSGLPIFRLDCNLKVSDPAAKVVVKGWYRTEDIEDIIAKLHATPLTKDEAAGAVQLRDALAKEFIARPKDAVAFWHAQPVRSPQPLDPPQGKYREWDSPPFLYHQAQLSSAKNVMMSWAEEWVLYRRDKLGNGK